MKFQKFDSMFFIGLVMAFGAIMLFLAAGHTMTVGTQLAFASGLGFGILGIWFVMQNIEKMSKKMINKHFPERKEVKK